MRISILTCIALCCSLRVFAQVDSLAHKRDSTVVFPGVVITATRVAEPAQLTDRAMDIVGGSALAADARSSVLDVLRMRTLADVQLRGAEGVQGDASMRGAHYGQVLVLLDGIRMNDPQTGHHNLDLPIPAGGIDRIEVMPGGGSALYGSDAFGGVVNVIPGIGGQSVRAGLSYGEHNYNGVDLSVAQPVANNLDVSFAGAYKNSDGFRYDTDFHVAEGFAHAAWRASDAVRVNAVAGLSRRSFGAYDFYSGPGTDVPSSEITSSTLVALSAAITHGDLTVTPRAYYRAHADRYTYLITMPDLYINDHHDHTAGGEVTATQHLGNGMSLVGGVEGAQDHLESVGLGQIPSGLGTHDITRGAVYAIVQRGGDGFTCNIGARMDASSQFAPQFDPTVSAGYSLTQSLHVFGTVARSYRAPSFTELYYVDPNNVGGADLQPEHAWSEELGVRAAIATNYSVQGAVFLRQGENTIDFVRDLASTTVSHAMNIPNEHVQGIEILAGGMYARPALGVVRSFRCGFTAIGATTSLSGVQVPRYTLVRPKQQALAALDLALPLDIDFSGEGVYKLRTQGDGYTLVQARLVKRFAIGASTLSLRAEGTNLLNITYEDLPGVPTPRRWMTVGIEIMR